MASTDITREFVLAKCAYFREVNLWPLRSVLDAEGWLENFNDHEKAHVVQLLNSFMYFSNDLLDEMFAAAFQGLSTKIIEMGQPLLRTQAAWRAFVDSVIVTYPTGEKPNVTDSGLVFARKARKLIEIPEERIKSPSEVLDLLFRSGPRPVVFVDDFVGTGSQFVKTWNRSYDLPSARGASFRRFATVRGTRFFYCPVLCTEHGLRELTARCPEVLISAAHLLSSQYSALAPDSLLWPDHLRTSAIGFLQEASKRAGIPDTGGSQPDDWQGFGRLGLALALADAVPDATMPIFYWERNGWRPLIRRT